MRRFFCRVEDIGQDYIYIKDRTEVHHIKNVLRMKVNDKIRVFSDNGCEYDGSICRINPQCIGMKIHEAKLSRANLKKNNSLISIACAIPKREKMDNIIDKLTQLGIYKIFPLETERTIVRWDARAKEKHLKRWQKIARSSAKQSGRIDIPEISNVLTLKQALSYVKDSDLAIMPNLYIQTRHIKDLIRETKFKNVFILIGPEGDFSPREVDRSRKAGFIPVSLGNLVLRVDTAAITVASFFKFSLE